MRPLEDDLARAAQILIAGEPHLAHIRMRGGGGPEQTRHDGRGWAMCSSSSRSPRYAGPSCSRRATARRRSSGSAGRRARAPRGSAASIAIAGRIEIDVRSVEPKDRIPTVLGGFEQVRPGGTLHLVVDHDPDCMRHMLSATQPQGSFSLELLERGPEVWRVGVVRRGARV